MIELKPLSELAKELRENGPLRKYHVDWDDITQDDVINLKDVIDNADSEEDIQQYLKVNPKPLVQHLVGGHGRWVIPKAKLGSNLVTDFILGVKHSYGYEWTLVELESHSKKLFKKSGEFTAMLNQAINQIEDWRHWLKDNRDYATRSLAENGLGLTSIDQNAQGHILIGRDSQFNTMDAEAKARSDNYRRSANNDRRIKIHTYDYLLRTLEGRLQDFEKNHFKPPHS